MNSDWSIIGDGDGDVNGYGDGTIPNVILTPPTHPT